MFVKRLSFHYVKETDYQVSVGDSWVHSFVTWLHQKRKALLSRFNWVRMCTESKSYYVTIPCYNSVVSRTILSPTISTIKIMV